MVNEGTNTWSGAPDIFIEVIHQIPHLTSVHTHTRLSLTSFPSEGRRSSKLLETGKPILVKNKEDLTKQTFGINRTGESAKMAVEGGPRPTN